MQPANEVPHKPLELVSLNVIRVETALSRYPVHRLARQGMVSIEIREQSPDGSSLVQWQVGHDSHYGQPGPLAYKIDTLIVNRRIEEASRPIPKLIKLGSIHDISKELGLTGGRSREHIKKSLYQNAFVSIKAKFKYRLADGTSKELEAGFTRYSVIFTGEELPDGRRADAVYLVLNEVFMQVISGAQTRPLDYDYLKDLPPASQRLYEVLSYQIYAALKYGRRQAKLSYSEFCTYAPLTRFFNWNQVRPQMARIHRDHLASGYIENVEFEQATDKAGKSDWTMSYTPGPKARAEFRAFTKKGGPRTLEVEQSFPSVVLPSQPDVSPLEQALVDRGVTPSTAHELVCEFPAEFVATKIEHFDWLREHLPAKVESPGGYLRDSIQKQYGTPAKFVSKADEEARAAKQRERLQEDAKEKIQKRQEAARQKAETQAIKHFWEALTMEKQQELEREAGISPEAIRPDDFVTKFQRTIQRDSHIRRLLGLQQDGSREG